MLVGVTGLLAGSIAPAATALADSGTLRIESPLNGSDINTATPVFTGTSGLGAEELEELEPAALAVTLKIHEGPNTGGAEVQPPISTSALLGGTWSIEPAEALPPGIYTTQAEQQGKQSEPVTFTVDTTPPVVTPDLPGQRQLHEQWDGVG